MLSLGAVSRSVLTSFLGLGLTSAVAGAGDLSRYRAFRFGTSLTNVLKRIDASPSEAKTVHSRPALIQELEWRPQPLGPSSRSEPAQKVVFTFYNGELFQIVVVYDRYETEGLTPDDLVEAISMAYGPAVKVPAPPQTSETQYGEQEELLARWQDSLYRFDLIRSSYGPTFKLVGVEVRLNALATTATAESDRLDIQEAPQRDAARKASEEEAVRANLEKARLTNKPKFRP